MARITASRLRDVLHYEPATGRFIWIDPGRRTERVGMVAGSANQSGYWRIQIDGRSYYAHRLAWLYEYGVWPEKQIDHANGNRQDNRIANLREATPSQNHGNTRRSCANKSGFKGVYADRGKWAAAIRLSGRKTRLGVFDTPKEAHRAYCAAAREEFGEFARAE